jgi:hypothetical protein
MRIINRWSRRWCGVNSEFSVFFRIWAAR